MKLEDIHLNYVTDKGTEHGYIPVYDELFFNIKNNDLNILEIGTLQGGSLKLWNEYFVNSKIYGVEDFSQITGFAGKIINKEEIIEDLKKYPRINLFCFDSEDVSKINYNLSNLKFDIIIDDASHHPENQIKNIINYIPFLKKEGLYIVEDVVSVEIANYLSESIKNIHNLDSKIININKNGRHDDRLIVVKNT